MRIAYCSDTYAPEINGVTHTLSELERWLGRSEHDARFFVPAYDDAHRTDTDIVRRFPSVSFPPYPACRLSLPRFDAFRRALDDFGPDLIHVVTPLGMGQAGRRYAKERGVPLVASFHTNFDTYLSYYRAKPLQPLIWGLFRRFHEDCQATFCPSQSTARTLKEQGIRNVRIWSRGIHADRFSPARRQSACFQQWEPDADGRDAPIRILTVGRLAREKDLDILLESMHALNERHDNLRFYLVGDGPQKDELVREAPDNCLFTGYVRGQALADLYASCDLFAFPSTTETFGNVVLEAMASGLPVVCAETGGVLETVRHGHNGLLTRPRDPAAFSHALDLLIRHLRFRLRLGQNARRTAEDRSWDFVFETLMEDYARIIAGDARKAEA